MDHSFNRFMERALEPIHAEEDRRERWANGVWFSISPVDRVAWALAYEKYAKRESTSERRA